MLKHLFIHNFDIDNNTLGEKQISSVFA